MKIYLISTFLLSILCVSCVTQSKMVHGVPQEKWRKLTSIQKQLIIHSSQYSIEGEDR